MYIHTCTNLYKHVQKYKYIQMYEHMQKYRDAANLFTLAHGAGKHGTEVTTASSQYHPVCGYLMCPHHQHHVTQHTGIIGSFSFGDMSTLDCLEKLLQHRCYYSKRHCE